MPRTKKQKSADNEFKESISMIPDPGEDLIKVDVSSVLILQTNPEVGDIIQVTDHSHTKYKAWIGIVHSNSIDGQITCYQPDGKNPNVFKVNTGSVEVVGRARLKWPGLLPEKSKDYNKLDKV